MPSEPQPIPERMPPFPAAGGEYEWNGSEYVRLKAPQAHGCEKKPKGQASIDGAEISTSAKN